MLTRKVQGAGGFSPAVGGWDISLSVYTGDSLNVSATLTGAEGVSFKPDGTKMFILSNGSDSLFEYALSVPWDITSATYSQSFYVGSQENQVRDLFFKVDGTSVYVIGSSGDDINEYALSTAWDISTLSYVQNASVSDKDTSPTGIYFKPDGAKVYVLGQTSDKVFEYNLSTAWDISTLSYVQEISILAEESGGQNLLFKPDGTKMYVIGSSGDDINEYALSTAWDISTALYTQRYVPTAKGTAPAGLFIRADGKKFFMCDLSNSVVYAYDL